MPSEPFNPDSIHKARFPFVARLSLRALRCASLLLLSCAALPCPPLSAQQSAQPTRIPKPIILPEANRPPDANDQMEMHQRQAKQKDFAAANAERRKQISLDSAKMLELASELKTDVNLAKDGDLSVDALKRIEAIELLAHDLKEKMKLMAGGG